jgi:ribulose-5-phosphate 4-epimerase/fuculose-1-phosphate aldolase
MLLTQVEQELVAKVATANHILAHKQIVDAFGHVSVRSPERPDVFFMARNLAPQLVMPNDVLHFDMEANCINEPQARVYLERFIHSEIYKARPDVNSIVHAHAISVLPYAALPDHPIKPLCHMSAWIGTGLPIFEIRTCCQGSDLLIRSPELGVALAKELGEKNGVLMRGHGFTVVADTIENAVYRAIYLDVNAKVQATAQLLGDPIFLDEAEASAATNTNSGQIHRPWALWKMEVEAAAKARGD